MKTILFLMSVITTVPATAQSIIYKCANSGKTTYSESPCRPNAYQDNRFTVQDDRMGNVIPQRQTIGGGNNTSNREHSREEASNTTGIRNGTGVRQIGNGKNIGNGGTCEAIQAELRDLDDAARRPQSGWMQDDIKRRKSEAHRRADDFNC